MRDMNEAEIFIHNELSNDEVAFRRWIGIKILGLVNQQDDILKEMRCLNDNYNKVNTKVNNFTYRVVAVASAFSLAFGFIGTYISKALHLE
jgi:hypothetical protein